MKLNSFSKLLAFVLSRILPIFRNQDSLFLHAATLAQLSSFRFAHKYVIDNDKGSYKHSALLLKANECISDESAWLRNFNSYLSSMSAESISLNGKSNSKYFRLQCQPSDKIKTGPLVSVLTTSFNSEKTIAHSIESILNQTWTNLEVIIVDDMSTDDTWNIISSLAKRDQRIKPFRNEYNVGTYVSKNIGLSLSHGAYITCHDSDDWAHPQRIQFQAMRMIKENAKASIILKMRVYENMEVTRFKRINKSCIDGVTHFSLPSIMYESTFLKEKLGSWDCVRFSADKEMYERAEIALKDEIKKYHIFGQICLETNQSLTNHPIYGLKKSKSTNSPRKLYRKSYRQWHTGLSENNTYLAFPQSPRPFKVPEIASIAQDSINKLLIQYKL